MMGRSPHQSSSSAAAAAAAAAAAYGLPPTTAAGGYGGLGTLSVAASQAASLASLNPASKSFASRWRGAIINFCIQKYNNAGILFFIC